MTTQDALAVLFAASILAPMPKVMHVQCEQAKTLLEDALRNLENKPSMTKGGRNKKPQEGK